VRKTPSQHPGDEGGGKVQFPFGFRETGPTLERARIRRDYPPKEITWQKGNLQRRGKRALLIKVKGLIKGPFSLFGEG